MMENNSIRESIIIKASAPIIWDILINPEKIKLYIGSATTTDWAVGSPISWEGEMQGMTYNNKGKVLENVPHNRLRYTFWSGMGGDIDLPENYSEITFELKPLGNGSVELVYSREKIPTEIEKEVFEQNLPSMLQEIKRLAEG
jgi:uncharacterized protein YndB with AHSA1/START domain